MITTKIIFEDNTTITFSHTIKLSCLEQGFKWYGTHSTFGFMVHDTKNYKYNLIKTENNITEIKATRQSLGCTPVNQSGCHYRGDQIQSDCCSGMQWCTKHGQCETID